MYKQWAGKVTRRSLVVFMLTSSSTVFAGGFWDHLGMQPAGEYDAFADANAVVIETETLAGLRGGFSVSGLDLDFGATLRTVVDDILYQTVMNLSESGAKVVSQSLVDPTGQAVIVNPQAGQSIVDLAPITINVPGLKQFSGIVLNDQNGFTSVLHNVTRNAIVGSVISDASNREIAHELNIDIQVNNIDALRHANQRAAILNSLTR
ncbi:hypothetical protein L861_13050 [Litchfieldella anticariensis FP35 = DSM 16096]|uniref:Uncharacterized protein n=1 Tax=Litchfieldella anticariensis (strain DSM 16096 / CECT 5854 / CIP 108499 / LMG 22089 / FP35) TaxID=1121939 RepID=S2KZ63_LITA3|nr:hypothetical protein [Halomonas anticariensis]EPC00714.1 hypothetical protein L861_13050 [Halomonas anticariensis FP35 = DSM 16096]